MRRTRESVSVSQLVELVRFILAGSMNAGLMYLLYLSLLQFGISYPVALTVDYAIGIPLGFLLQKTWTFRNRGAILPGFARYLFVYVVVFAVNLAFLACLVEVAGLPPGWGQLAALALTTALSFSAQRGWVFRADRKPHELPRPPRPEGSD